MDRFAGLDTSIGDQKPRVLVVDDHPAMLDRITAILEGPFDVAGVAADGRQALDTARQIDPDAIVLDINMPGLDGFQTMRALAQAGSRAPVVFLSMVDADDQVGEAFRCGGRGYVVKAHAGRDLLGALDQVLRGRLFAPSLTSLLTLGSGGGHAVQRYGHRESFLDDLTAFYDLALRRGDATCVISTEDVREGLSRRLRAAGWDVGGPSGHPRYMVVDAAAALSRIIRGGLPDPDRLAEIVAELDEFRRTAAGDGARLTIFGDMVVSLIADDNPTAAIALERQWNTLTHSVPFFTLCGYAPSSFIPSVPDLWSSACAEHGIVCHSHDV
jgi:DNA-binding NarL/FixJ family response regulator